MARSAFTKKLQYAFEFRLLNQPAAHADRHCQRLTRRLHRTSLKRRPVPGENAHECVSSLIQKVNFNLQPEFRQSGIHAQAREFNAARLMAGKSLAGASSAKSAKANGFPI